MKRVVLLIAVIGMISCNKDEVLKVDPVVNQVEFETRLTPVFDGSEGTYLDSAEYTPLFKAWDDNSINTGDNKFIVPRSNIEYLMTNSDVTDILFAFGEDSIYGIPVDQYNEPSFPSDTVSGMYGDDTNAWANVSGRDTSSASVYVGVDILNDFLDNDCQNFIFESGELSSGKYTLVMSGTDSDGNEISPCVPCVHGRLGLLLYGVRPYKIRFILSGMMCLQHFLPADSCPCHNGIYC